LENLQVLPDYLVDLFRRRKKLIVVFFATSLARTITSVALIYLVQQYLSVTIGKGGWFAVQAERVAGRAAVPWITAGCLLTVYFATTFLGYANKIVQQRAIQFMEMSLMDRIIRKLMELSVQYVNRRSPGDLIQMVRQDVVELRCMVNAYTSIVLEGMLIAGLACTLVWLSPWLALWTLGALPLASVPLLKATTRRLKRASEEIRATGYHIFDFILQMLAGMRIIKTFRAEENQAAQMMVHSRDYFAVLFDVVRVRAIARVVVEALGGLSLVLVIVLGGFLVTGGKLAWPVLMAFVMALRTIFVPLYNIYGYHSEIHTYSAAVRRIGDVLATQPAVFDRPDAVPLPEAPQRIAFEAVSFAYDHSPVLAGIDFEVRAGETIGIVGPSGSGKSTLLNLLVRFYDPTSGRVLFDGRDLREFRLADLLEKTAVVTQEPFLFSATVRENIRCGRPGASDSEVEKAARAANIHEEIQVLPQGYDTPVGIAGRELSRGQAQRINIARALLRNAPLLILDEATSSLDSLSESEVQKSIDRLMEGRTSLVVAHRLSTLRNADRVIVLDAGGCAGIGSHTELLRMCPLYRELWEKQALTHGWAPVSA
jgi:ABC-type multidrug transport system fused ATPase/permease subunit